MSNHQDEKLDRMLHARRIEPASGDLAERIILKARQTPQAPSFWQSVREFHLPQPAYVLAGALMVGLIIGFSAPQDTPLALDDGASIQSFLSADEGLL
jgi:hypothetical protein